MYLGVTIAAVAAGYNKKKNTWDYVLLATALVYVLEAVDNSG